jgi:hypothetical protein
MAETATPPAMQAVLRSTSTDGLLSAIIRLTHTIHGSNNPTTKSALRIQRGRVMDEIKRRTTVHDMPLPDPRLPGLTHVGLRRIEDEEAAR